MARTTARREETGIKLPGWIFGALAVLSLFVAGAVGLTRWLDAQIGRSPVAPACADEHCGPDETAPTTIEPPSSRVSVASPTAAPSPIAETPPADTAAPGDARRRPQAAIPADTTDLAAPPFDPPRAVTLSGHSRAHSRSRAARESALSGGARGSTPSGGAGETTQSGHDGVGDASTPAVPREAGVAARRSDAGPIGPRCGSATCPVEQVCCNPSCGTCALPGASCEQTPCPSLTIPCGSSTCNANEICCNPSCGICTPHSGTCRPEPCQPGAPPRTEPCGSNLCKPGQICCNESCGICMNPGETCSFTEPCK